jgi:hypothetical protein
MNEWPFSAKLVVLLLSSALAGSGLVHYYSAKQAAARPLVLTPEEMLEMARTHFPKEFIASGNREDLALAFVLDQSRRVTAKALTNTSTEEPAIATLKRSFPGVDLKQLSAAGTLCFPEQLPQHGKFCVLWAVPST